MSIDLIDVKNTNLIRRDHLPGPTYRRGQNGKTLKIAIGGDEAAFELREVIR